MRRGFYKPETVNRIEVELPTLHSDQERAFWCTADPRADPGHSQYDESWLQNGGGRFVSHRCGRRWGKTVYGQTWEADGAIRGMYCGWFAPSYKYLNEVFEEVALMLEPLKPAVNRSKNFIRLPNGGRIDFWTLEDDRAGRGRRYHRVFIDEAAFTGSNMMEIWRQSIKPTLLDYHGSCKVGSNTNGVSEDNFLWQICHQPEHGFIDFHAPSIANPLIPARIIARPGGSNYTETIEEWQERRDKVFADMKSREHPLVWLQEYEAEFVDWRGVAFFSLDKLLLNGRPAPDWQKCDYVFAVVDTATKTGSGNDGTAVTYFAFTRHWAYPLMVIDWHIEQIEGALLETWLPTVFRTLEEWAVRLGARRGSAGAFIEDAASGMVLIQHAQNNQWPVTAIPQTLTALGKDERAISISGYHHREMVKIGQQAYDKTLQYKQSSRNHWISQVTSFRVGDKDAAKRADDLLDTYTYGVALGLGNSDGF